MTEKPTFRWLFGHSCFTTFACYIATYVRCGGMSTVLYSKFPAESVSERIFKIGYDLTNLLPKFGGLVFWNSIWLLFISCVFHPWAA